MSVLGLGKAIKMATAMQGGSETARMAATEAALEEAPAEFPVREYIGAMALELAQMARWDGDEALARILESAASLAGEAIKRTVVAQPAGPRAA